jgi:hypothetical protein
MNQNIFFFLYYLLIYKIEEVDNEYLEPLSSINLGIHKIR